MNKKFLIISLVIIVIIFIGVSIFSGNMVYSQATQLTTNEENKGIDPEYWDIFGMDIDVFRAKYKIEKIEIKSTLDGHTIPADYMYADGVDNKDNDTMVVVHGLWANRLSVYPYAEYFLEKGFNVIVYDQRSSGENMAEHTTFGYWESEDLKDYVKYVTEQINDKKIGLWGTSFGGATVSFSLNTWIQDVVDFAILDCPVSDMREMIDLQLSQINIPLPNSYILWCGNIMIKAKLGFGYEDINIKKAVSETKIPVLVVNSKADTLTPYHMGVDLYESINHTDKSIVSSEDSGHASVWVNDNELYRNAMDDFLSNH